MPDPILRDLDQPPKLSYSFIWADHVELQCLTNRDGIYTPATFQDIVNEETDLSADIEPFESNEASALDDQDSQLSRRWSDIFSRLKARQIAYGDAWPFTIDGQVLKLNFSEQNPLHKLYIALLVASALRYCPPARRHEVTSSLEEIGYHIFKAIMPESWEVHPFGAHQSISDRYKGKLIDKIETLVSDIHAKILVARTDFELNDTGDAGLDLVAWSSLEDNREGIPIAFGQCGCTPEEWPLKSLEAHTAKLGGIFNTLHDWATYYIMPHDMRRLDGGWEKRSDMGKVILLDRFRILRLAKKHSITLPSWSYVNEATKLSLFAV
jgi:hypothetical protein